MWPRTIIARNILKKKHIDLLSKIIWSTEGSEWSIIKTTCTANSINVKVDAVVPPKNAPTKAELFEIYTEYQPLMLALLGDLAPEKVSKVTFTELNIVCTGKDYKFGIHNDTEDKLLSVVIYVSPEINEGTWLYDTCKGENPRQVPWEVNKAFIFSRNEESWHSYRSDGKTNRIALVYNLRGT